MKFAKSAIVVTAMFTLPSALHASDTTITSSGNSGTISVTASGDRFAGSISSITYRGVQYIDIFDHGREMQTAIQVDGFGECINPNEAGSYDDAQKYTSSSILNYISNTNNILRTVSTPAYWLAPNEHAPDGCGESAATTGQNTSPYSSYTFARTTTVSPYSRNLFDATMTITVPENRSSSSTEALTAYLPSSFNNWLAFDPVTRTLIKLSASGSIQRSAWPLIVAQANGKNSMGVISPGIYSSAISDGNNMNQYYAYIAYPGSSSTDKWSCVYGHGPISAGDKLQYNCLFSIGSVDEVIASFESYPIPGLAYSNMIPIFRFYTMQKHFFTVSYDEGAGASMTFETTGFHIFSSYQPGYHALYRCFNSAGSDHFISTQSNCEGFTNEGTLGYAADTQINGTVPLYRFYYRKTADHLMTVNPNEASAYVNDGVLGYVNY